MLRNLNKALQKGGGREKRKEERKEVKEGREGKKSYHTYLEKQNKTEWLVKSFYC